MLKNCNYTSVIINSLLLYDVLQHFHKLCIIKYKRKKRNNFKITEVTVLTNTSLFQNMLCSCEITERISETSKIKQEIWACCFGSCFKVINRFFSLPLCFGDEVWGASVMKPIWWSEFQSR